MDWIEVTARTVEDAKELALDRLGVVEAELEYEVLDEPRSGLFRRADARIRARVKPLSREKPADRRRRRRGSERAGGERPSSRSSASREATKTASDDEARPATVAAAGNGSPGGSRTRRRRGGRGRSGAGRTAEGAGGVATVSRDGAPTRGDEQDNVEAEVDVETVPVEEQAAHAAEFAGDLVRTMGFRADVRTEVDDDDVTIHIDGDNLGVLVGPKGVTLHALEEVVRAVTQRYAGGHSARVHVDVGGYRERRRAALAEFAGSVAEAVRDSGTAQSLEPMSAPDRKVVHDVVAEIAGVATSSEGEEPRRRVVIRPE